MLVCPFVGLSTCRSNPISAEEIVKSAWRHFAEKIRAWWHFPTEKEKEPFLFELRFPSSDYFAGVLCGAAASGHFEWNLDNVGKSALCMLMSGPLLTGYTQTINDYFDKDLDAINEPYRPIPSGIYHLSRASVVTEVSLLADSEIQQC